MLVLCRWLAAEKGNFWAPLGKRKEHAWLTCCQLQFCTAAAIVNVHHTLWKRDALRPQVKGLGCGRYQMVKAPLHLVLCLAFPEVGDEICPLLHARQAIKNDTGVQSLTLLGPDFGRFALLQHSNIAMQSVLVMESVQSCSMKAGVLHAFILQ